MTLSDVAKIQWLDPWKAIESSAAARAVEEELAIEANPQHVLFGVKTVAVARRVDCDDWLLFIELDPPRLAVVHLTCSHDQERYPQVPTTTFYDTIESFHADCMLPEHRERNAQTMASDEPRNLSD